MYKEIERVFPPGTTRRTIVEMFMRYGLSIRNGRLYCGDIELSVAKVARAIPCDRRVVIQTIQTISKNPQLYQIFSMLRPTAFIEGIAKLFDFEVLVIEADPRSVGLLADIAMIIKEEGIVIRQVVADDSEIYPQPKLTLILEKRLPGEALERIRKLKGVRKLILQ